MKNWIISIISLIIIGIIIIYITNHLNDYQQDYSKWYDNQANEWFEQDRKTHGFGTYNYNLSFDGDNRHYGIDYRLPVGTDILAPTDGVVTRIFEDDLGGNVLEIQEENGRYYEWFMHLSDYEVKVGDSVETGDVIAKSGNTGERTTGPHLHFQRMKGGIGNRFAEDPEPFIDSLPNGQRSLYRLK